MKLLAVDTATERCSVAAHVDGAWFERSVDTARGHADIVLSMIDEVLTDSGLRLAQLDGIAYGRGPGGFTGVRIAIGVVQGLAFGANLPTVGVSNLAAVAQQAAAPNRNILVCMDARMKEIYWAQFRCDASGRVQAVGAERLSAPEVIDVECVDILIGSAAAAYPALAARYSSVPQVAALPRAHDIAVLAEYEFAEGRARSAFDVQPVYLRDQVTFVKTG